MSALMCYHTSAPLCCHLCVIIIIIIIIIILILILIFILILILILILIITTTSLISFCSPPHCLGSLAGTISVFFDILYLSPSNSNLR